MSTRSASSIAVSIITRIVVCAVLLLGAGAVFEWLVSTQPVLEGEPLLDGEQRLVTFAPSMIPIRRQWNGFGSAVAMDRADIPARVVAAVIEVSEGIDAGRSVSADQTIAVLDDADFQQQREAAAGAIEQIDAELARLDVEEAAWRERVALAERDAGIAADDVERVRDAMADGAAKQRELDTAMQRAIAADRIAVAAREELSKVPSRRAGLKGSRASQGANLQLAQLNIDRCRIRSPIAGVLQSVDVKPGEMVASGMRVARVVGLDRIEVPLLLPASARTSIMLGDEVVLTDAAIESRQWTARIARIAPEDDATTRTMTVYAELAGGDSPLAPGRFVRGTVDAGDAVPRQAIPRRAVRGDRVYVVRDGRVQQREVRPVFNLAGPIAELGLPDTAWVVLAEPLPEGDLVVLDGSRSLPVGAPALAVGADGNALRAEAVERRPPLPPKERVP